MLTTARAPRLVAILALLSACSAPAAPAPAPAPSAAAPAPAAERIRVAAPLENALVTSPLAIRGEARGSWFFEATFPVVLRDAHGQELAKHYATADGEWMTDQFVPFTARLEFARPATRTGTLVLQRANASGLPEHDAALEVPVRFSE